MWSWPRRPLKMGPAASRAQGLLHVVTVQNRQHQDSPVHRTLPSVLGHLRGEKDLLGSSKAQPVREAHGGPKVPVSQSLRAKTRNLIVGVAELPCQVNSRPCPVSRVKARAELGKEWACEMRGEKLSLSTTRTLQSWGGWLQRGGPVHRKPLRVQRTSPRATPAPEEL